MKVLLTGATGFIGSHAVEHYLKTTDWDLILLEGLNYASSMRRLTEMDVWPLENERVQVVYHNIQSPLSDDVKSRIGNPDAIIHFAAETHVERALVDPAPFVMSNVVGTMHMLDYAREVGVGRYIQISTDEVYGPAPEGVFFKEGDPYHPSNPYSATKAGADCLAFSYHISFKVPVIVTNTMNNFGERQHPEKFVPKTIRSIVRGEKVLLHGTPGNVGSRCWLHARNHADAIKFIIQHGQVGQQYHVSSNDEYSVEEMADMIAHSLGGMQYQREYVDFHATRPGHDRRYALDGAKLRSLGWNPPVMFYESLERVIKWTKSHADWLQEVR